MSNGTVDDAAVQRRLFMVLSPRALSYARLALSSLLSNAVEPFVLSLITDSEEDKSILYSEMNARSGDTSQRSWTYNVFSESDLDERAAGIFGKFENIMSFRRGHACWRKVTDPVLLSSGHEEMIILDPDIYFPNRFVFEQTPQSGLLLMWQRPSCLLPASVVTSAMQAGVRLAHHTDIGVAQWRMPIDLDWLDWLLGKLGSPNLPKSMHVESIVWAALAMRLGGGYLDPKAWLCWRRSQLKRIGRKLGWPGESILRGEPWEDIKCFHAGGEAKWWLAEAKRLGYLRGGDIQSQRYDPIQYKELTKQAFARLERSRGWLRTAGYYRLFDSA